MTRKRRIKIIATLGPASFSRQKIRRLFEAGADVFRVNMSHTDHERLRKLHGHIRKLEAETHRPIAILVDLQGPKLRIGDFANKHVALKAGDTITFDRDPTPGDRQRVYLPHPEIFDAVAPGHTLILDDGKMVMQVIEVTDGRMTAKAVVDGILASRKGISLPDTLLPVSALTDKDRMDLEFAATLGVDWAALSFVQRVEDVMEARKLARGRVAIMAKIEKPPAIQHLDEIMDMSEGLMVARGDLGVEMPLEKVPGLQKRILRAARRAGKPVVVATQMLESMIKSPAPTRAEVSDVATAVYEGADAVMLSAETAMGKYPVEAVKMMSRIAWEVESEEVYRSIIHAQRTEPEPTAADAISAAARTIADTLDLSAIICYTSTGSTGLRAARERPNQPILGLTPVPATARRLALVWGVHCVLTADPKDLEDMVDKACRIALAEGFADKGSRVIITAGVPLGTPGATNMLRVAYVGSKGALTLAH